MVNAEQATHWNTAAGPRWATFADRTDRLFGEVTSALLKFAGVQGGEVELGAGLWLVSARA